jgi:hypothetical protein
VKIGLNDRPTVEDSSRREVLLGCQNGMHVNYVQFFSQETWVQEKVIPRGNN